MLDYDNGDGNGGGGGGGGGGSDGGSDGTLRYDQNTRHSDNLSKQNSKTHVN